jgi:type II secretory pathway component PulK
VRAQRGSALMLVLFAIVVMGFAIASMATFLDASQEENALVANQFRALAMAESGIALGVHPQLKPGDPALHQDIGSDGSIDVTITSEEAKLPINQITTAGYRDVVYNLFVYWGLSTDEASIAADSLADWVDPDDDVRSEGAESAYYQGLGYTGFPRNQGFTSVEEMILVRGMDAVERVKPDWRNYFSVLSDGVVDVNYASKDVLMAVTGAQESYVDNLIRERSGPDGIPGTQDDVTLTITSAATLLGLDTAALSAIQSRLTQSGLMRRVESIGRVGEQKYKVVVVARIQNDGSLTYLARTEE